MAAPESSDEAAAAAAAAGVLAGMSATAWRAAGPEPLVDALLTDPTPWKPDLPRLDGELASTHELARRWRTAVAGAERVRLQFDGVSDDRGSDWVELVRTRAPGVHGAFFPIRQRWPRGPRWEHPPTIGFAESLAPGEQRHVLVVTGGGAVPERVRATFVLIVGPDDEDAGRALARTVHASGWAAVEAPAGFVRQLRGRLAEAPLDVALCEAARATGLPVPRLFASPPALRWTDPEEYDLPPWDPPTEKLPSLEHGASRELRDPGGWLAHSDPRPSLPSRPRAKPRSRRPAPQRYVQGKLLPPGAEVEAPGVEAVKPLRPFDLALQIGPPSRDWVITPQALPETTLEPGVTHALRVVLALPDLQKHPASTTVTLPADGSSTVARFPLLLRRDRIYVGRVIVLHRGRVLQTVIVELRSGVLRLSPETEPRPGLDDLEGRGEFGAAFIVNHSADGTPGATLIPHDGVPVFLPPGWATAADALQRALQVLVDRQLEGDAQFPLAVYDLALQGDLLRRQVDPQRALSAALPPLQVVAARRDAWLPLELVYDGPIPEDDSLTPTVCERSLQRLRADAPGACDGPHADGTICLLGFWGLRTVIERQAYDPANAGARWEFSLRAPTPPPSRLSRPTAAVFAAHRNADVVLETASQGVIAALEGLGFTDPQVFKWRDWCRRVDDEQPGLLVALAHTDWFAPSIPMLAIEDDRLKLNSIAAEHVSDGTVNPVVLLMGCSTANVPVPFQGIAAAFRDAGAPVVVATIADVYGRYAGPAATAAIERFANAADEELDVGTAMLRLRRKLMGDGLPIGLGLLAYGDAEWRLARSTTP